MRSSEEVEVEGEGEGEGAGEGAGERVVVEDKSANKVVLERVVSESESNRPLMAAGGTVMGPSETTSSLNTQTVPQCKMVLRNAAERRAYIYAAPKISATVAPFTVRCMTSVKSPTALLYLQLMTSVFATRKPHWTLLTMPDAVRVVER